VRMAAVTSLCAYGSCDLAQCIWQPISLSAYGIRDFVQCVWQPGVRSVRMSAVFSLSAYGCRDFTQGVWQA
jgi:hypothetical protein